MVTFAGVLWHLGWAAIGPFVAPNAAKFWERACMLVPLVLCLIDIVVTFRLSWFAPKILLRTIVFICLSTSEQIGTGALKCASEMSYAVLEKVHARPWGLEQLILLHFILQGWIVFRAPGCLFLSTPLENVFTFGLQVVVINSTIRTLTSRGSGWRPIQSILSELSGYCLIYMGSFNLFPRVLLAFNWRPEGVKEWETFAKELHIAWLVCGYMGLFLKLHSRYVDDGVEASRTRHKEWKAQAGQKDNPDEQKIIQWLTKIRDVLGEFHKASSAWPLTGRLIQGLLSFVMPGLGWISIVGSGQLDEVGKLCYDVYTIAQSGWSACEWTETQFVNLIVNFHHELQAEAKPKSETQEGNAEDKPKAGSESKTEAVAVDAAPAWEFSKAVVVSQLLLQCLYAMILAGGTGCWNDMMHDTFGVIAPPPGAWEFLSLLGVILLFVEGGQAVQRWLLLGCLIDPGSFLEERANTDASQASTAQSLCQDAVSTGVGLWEAVRIRAIQVKQGICSYRQVPVQRADEADQGAGPAPKKPDKHEEEDEAKDGELIETAKVGEVRELLETPPHLQEAIKEAASAPTATWEMVAESPDEPPASLGSPELG